MIRRSPLSMRVGIRIASRGRPMAVCTSSGTIGHSLSLGKADAVCVVSDSCPLADAAATAVGNLIHTAGDIAAGIEYGKKIKDPYTKETIGREEIYTATIEVTRVNPKQSYAKIIKSGRDLARNFQPRKFVCRIPQEQEDDASARRKKRAEERKKRDKRLDDDW